MANEIIATTAPVSRNGSDHESERRIDWLRAWQDPIPFICDPSDAPKIKNLKTKVRIYVRGFLAEFNAEKGTNYVVTDFRFDRNDDKNFGYEVSAFLYPPLPDGAGHDDDHDEGGGHLIPPPPPPPDKVD